MRIDFTFIFFNMENKDQIEHTKLKILKMINEQSRDYEKWAIELSKSYIGHILTISALFIWFLPQFIKDLNLKWYFLGIFSIWEIFLVLVIILMLIIYFISIKHQEYNVASANRLYNIIANWDNQGEIKKSIRDIWLKSEEKNITIKSTINTLSIIGNTLFFLWIVLVFIPILISLYN